MSHRVYLVTGCLGFLGTHLVDSLLADGHVVYGIDAETYAANLPWFYEQNLGGSFIYRKDRVESLTHLPDVDVVFHCAAETHVDNSLTDATAFLTSNVLGTHRLLDLFRGKRNSKAPTLIHVSTDEVFGPSHFPRQPDDRLNPRNPYAASKAAAEHLVTAYAATYDLRCRIVRPTNLYGARQYPEKLIPRAVRRLSRGLPMPIHGDGTACRSWLAVQDAVAGLRLVADKGQDGRSYHLGGNTTVSVSGVVRAVADALGRTADHITEGPNPVGEFEYQRPGMDVEYQLNDTTTRALGWEPQGLFLRDLPRLVHDLQKEPYR